MTPAALWASLAPETRRRLTTPSTARGLLQLALHGAAIGTMATYVALGGPLWWVVLLPLGIALAFLFTLQHECTHKTPFAAPWLNDVVGHLCGVILAQPFIWFRAFHLAHHKYTNDPENDPELQGDAKPETWRALCWHLSTLGYWRAKLQVLWGNATTPPDAPYISSRVRPKVQAEARLMLGIYGAAFLFTLVVSPILLWIWVVPLILGFPVLRLYLLAEHGRCPAVANMFHNSRTTRTTALMRQLAWNMPYHAEHHAFPQIPFHKLPQAHSLTQTHLGAVADGYLSFAKEYTADLKGTAGGAP